MSEYDEMPDNLQKEYDEVFSSEEKVVNALKITSDKFTRETRVIKLKEIGFSQPTKTGRKKTVSGLTQSIKELGVVTPIHVMTVEDEDDDYKYVLLDGFRRVWGAAKNNLEEIDAVVWDFKDKEQGRNLALVLSLTLNRAQKRTWSEIWDLYQILEYQCSITPGGLESLFQLEGGDAMKLKDVMLCDYSEVKEALLNDEKSLDSCYKMLQKLRKEEDQLAKEDSTGISNTTEEAQDLAGDTTGGSGQLSDQDVLELLEMADDLDNLGDVDEDDFDSLNQGVADSQAGGERHPLDPALKSAVLSRDNFRCKCCGFGGAAALGVLAVHHKLPVHTFAKNQPTDYPENLTTLCLRCHILVHIAERNGGKLQMTKADFEQYSSEDKESLMKVLKLARVAVEADKRKNISLDDVRKATTDAIRHPMPGAGMKENKAAYDAVKANKLLSGE